MTLPIQTEKNRRRRYFYDRQSGAVYPALSDITRPKEIDEEGLAYFLQTGFVPGHRTLFKDIDCLPGGCEIVADEAAGWRIAKRARYQTLLDRSRFADLSQAQLIEEGKKAFLRAMENCWKREKGQPVVVPLSGGIDSRGILAALLEFTAAPNIQTYTFGVPGAWDYDIGNRVARWAGTQHRAFDLRQASLDEEKLLRTARLTDSNTDLFQPAFLMDILDHYGREATFWSGFAGDAIAGTYYSKAKAGETEEDIRQEFLKKERLIAGTMGTKALNPALLDTQSAYAGAATKREAFYLDHRLERYVTHQILFNTIHYAFPYLESSFLRFIWSIPAVYRKDKQLFDRVMASAFPAAFRLPVKKNFGLPLKAAPFRVWSKKLWFVGRLRLWQRFPAIRWNNPMVNYLDFDRGLRGNAMLQQLVTEALGQLKKRGLLAPAAIDQTWRDHRHFHKNNGRQLTQLASLEYILRGNGIS